MLDNSVLKDIEALQDKVNKLASDIVTLSREDLVKALDLVISKNLRETDKLDTLNSIKALIIFFGTVSTCLVITILLVILFTVPA